MKKDFSDTILMIVFSIGLTLFLFGCSTPRMHQDVELGNESNDMMQCRVLCDANKIYAYNKSDLNCQCQRPVQSKSVHVNPVIKLEVDRDGETIKKGVMTELLDGNRIMSIVPGGRK